MSIQTPVRLPTYEVAIVIQQFAEFYDELANSLRPFMARTTASTVAGVDLYYRHETDTAMFLLRLDGRYLSRTNLSFLEGDAHAAGAALLETARLPEAERQRFYSTYLTLYKLQVRGLPTFEDALRMLGRDLGHDTKPTAQPNAKRVRRLEVRFRRGSEWQLGRVRSVSTEGLFVATGCPPRPGEVVELELVLEVPGSEPITAQTRAAVAQVTPVETASALGAIGFGARFLLSTPAERHKVDQVLAAARDAALPSPPRRRDVRYPVRWPVVIDVLGRRTSLAALDVSMRGMFVAADSKPASSEVELTVNMDDGGPTVRAAARIARAIEPDIARRRGISTGFGLEFTAFAPEAAQRFEGFVDRVARRASRSVIVGATNDRVGTILGELAAAGYVTSGACDPKALVVQLAGSRPPDLVILDSAFERANPRGTRIARSALASAKITALDLDTPAPGSARGLADAALLS